MTSRIPIQDTLHAHVRPRSQEHQPDQNPEDIHRRTHIPLPAPTRNPTRIPIIDLAHTNVGEAPENKAEEGIKERRDEGQQVGKEGDDLGDDEGEDPGDGEDASPGRPADDGMVADVAGASESVEEDETRRDGGVEDAEEEHGGDHEGEGDELVGTVAEGAESRGRVVGGAGVGVGDAAADGEEDDLGDGDGPEGFGEVAGLFHLGDEGGQRDLADEGVADVEEGGEAGHEGRARGGDREDVDGVGGVEASGFVFDGCEDCGEENGDEGEEGGGARDLGEGVEGAGQAHEPGYKCEDGAETNGAD